MRRLRHPHGQRYLAGVRQHFAEIDVARLVVRRVGVGKIRGQHADPLPVQQQRLFMDAENVVKHAGDLLDGNLKQELCQTVYARVIGRSGAR